VSKLRTPSWRSTTVRASARPWPLPCPRCCCERRARPVRSQCPSAPQFDRFNARLRRAAYTAFICLAALAWGGRGAQPAERRSPSGCLPTGMSTTTVDIAGVGVLSPGNRSRWPRGGGGMSEYSLQGTLQTAGVAGYVSRDGAAAATARRVSLLDDSGALDLALTSSSERWAGRRDTELVSGFRCLVGDAGSIVWSDRPIACWPQSIVQFHGCAHARQAFRTLAVLRGAGLSATLRTRRAQRSQFCLGGVGGMSEVVPPRS
jgi:hypothetical protein